MVRPDCRWCEQEFRDTLLLRQAAEGSAEGSDTTAPSINCDCIRASAAGAQCRLCLRVIARMPFKFETDRDKQIMEDKIKQDKSWWMDKRQDVLHSGGHGRSGIAASGGSVRGEHVKKSNLKSKGLRNAPDSRGQDEVSAGEATENGDDDIRVEPHKVGKAHKLKKKLSRRQVLRWQKGVFWPTLKLKKEFAKKNPDKTFYH